MNDLSKNIKKVLMVFIVLFTALFIYIGYFEIFVAPKIITNADNKRTWARRNEVLRGNFYDNSGRELTTSERTKGLSQKRTYVDGDLFSHMLGYVDPSYGITGMEQTFDKYLMKDNSMNLSSLIKNKFKAVPKQGDNVMTTFDYEIQKAAYDALGDFKGSVVVLDAKTSAVLASVSKPTFDANTFDETWKIINNDENSPLINRATNGLYPPGSVFKAITTTSALENISGVTTDIFKDNGSLKIGGDYTLPNYGGQVHGNINLKQGFTVSSNVVFAELALDLGNGALKTTAENYYFNKPIPAYGFNISQGRFPKYEEYEKGNIAQSGIGQAGIMVSPMQMALVAQSIANDGVMMKPYVASKVTDVVGKEVETIKPEQLGQVTSSSNAKTIKEYMLNVVQSGTGRNAKVYGTKVAGKTGTAEHAPGKAAHSWFIGFAPYDNPEIAIAVVLEEGDGSYINAAKVAGDILKVALK